MRRRFAPASRGSHQGLRASDGGGPERGEERPAPSALQTLAFDALDAPIAVVGSRNGITPGPEMESFFFPQVSWILDAIHERILPLPGHVPTTKHATEAEIARLNRAGL